MEGILPNNIFNFDGTNLVNDHDKKKILTRCGTKYLELFEQPPRQGHLICSAVAPREICYPCLYYTNPWSTWSGGGPPGTRYNNSPSGWFDSASFLEWFESIFIPETRRLEGKNVVICDNVAFHFST